LEVLPYPAAALLNLFCQFDILALLWILPQPHSIICASRLRALVLRVCRGRFCPLLASREISRKKRAALLQLFGRLFILGAMFEKGHCSAGIFSSQRQTVSVQKQGISIQKRSISVQKQSISVQKQSISI
jgi:hypothetical protein